MPHSTLPALDLASAPRELSASTLQMFAAKLGVPVSEVHERLNALL